MVRGQRTQMHIMHVIDGLPLGGAERMLVDIANATVARGDRVSACVTRTCIDLASSLDPRIRLHVLGRTRRFDFKALRRLPRLVHEEKVDVLHAHSRSTFSLLSATKMFAWLKTPIILHDHYSIEMNACIPVWFRFAVRFCLHRYVGVYARLAEWAERAGVPRQRIEVIGNALDLSRLQNGEALDLHREFGFSKGDRVGVVVAGIRAEKGIDLLLQALALAPLAPGVKLLLIGSDADPNYAQRCRQLATQLKLDACVQFTGKRHDVPSIIKGADFALMTSRSESGPLVLIEYMAAGLPLVSTQVGDIAQRAAKAGLPGFVPPDNAPAFRDAFNELLTLPPSGWQARAAMGRRLAGEHFDIRQVMPRWHAVYRQAVNDNS